MGEDTHIENTLITVIKVCYAKAMTMWCDAVTTCNLVAASSSDPPDGEATFLHMDNR